MTRRRAAGVAAGLATVAIAGAGLWLAGPLRTAQGSAGPPRFVDETADSGIALTYDGPFEFFTGGGVAVMDCDDDGRPDVYVAGGTNAAALYRNESAVGGSLRFTKLASPVTDLDSVTGAYPLDIDGDGSVDLAVLRIGGDVLLRGTGDCGFERANERWGFEGASSPTMAFAATWEGTNRLPTLAFGNYVNPAATGVADKCVDNVLLRPRPTESVAYLDRTDLHPSWCTLSLLFSDWSGTGRRDLRVSNDRHFYVAGQEQLWRMDPGAPPREYSEADGWVTVNVEGMGIASYDLDNDGAPEVFLTSQGSNRLQELIAGPSKPTYGDIGLKRGVNAERPFTGGDTLPSTAWHPEFEDVNNDGLVDLFISKGNVREQADFAMKDPSNLLLGQPDGSFRESADAAGILDFDLGRGAALADFNLDGLLDLVEVHLGSPVRMWRNLGAGTGSGGASSSFQPSVQMGHWVAVRVGDPTSPNHDAIGSWLEVRSGDRAWRRELTVGGGHSGGELGWVHVGLGNATGAEVRVRWPDGEIGPWQPVAADRFVLVRRGEAAPLVWNPPAG